MIFCLYAGNFAELIERWFDYLYEHNVVVEDVFLKWEKDDVVSAGPSKGPALIGAKELLDRLKTAE